MNQPPATGAKLQGLDPRLQVLGVLVLAALVYLPTLGYGFVYDDGWTIRANGFLRTPEDLWVLLTPQAVARHVPDAFRPTSVLLDVASYQAFGLDTALHHALSIALHIAVCVAFERLLARLGAPDLTRVVAVGLFGVLAIHAEAVTVISFREDLLAALLGLLALLAVDRGVTASSPAIGLAWLGPAMVLQALACGAKMNAAAMVLFWLLATRVSPWRAPLSRRRSLLGAAVLVAGVGAALCHTWVLFGSWTPYGGAENLRLAASTVGLWPVLAKTMQIHLGYVQQLIVPAGLAPEYVDAGAAWSEPATILATAAIASLLAYGVWCSHRRRRPLVALAILGTAALMLPTSNLFAMPNMRADRFMYLPSMAAALGLAAGSLALGRALAARLGRPQVTLLPAIVVAVIHGAVAQATSIVYRSDTRLWEIALRRAPASARAHAVTGQLLVQELRRSPRIVPDPAVLARARAHCAIAVTLDPQDDLTELCRARLAVVERDWPAAARRFRDALALSFDRSDRILAGLAQVSLDLPDAHSGRAQAMEALVRGLREYPYSPEIHGAAGRIHHRLARPQDALFHYRRARSLRPERWEVVVWGLELALDLGDAAAAERTFVDLEHSTLEAADPPTRAALRARLTDARSLFPPTLLQYLLSPGVFPNDP